MSVCIARLAASDTNNNDITDYDAQDANSSC